VQDEYIVGEAVDAHRESIDTIGSRSATNVGVPAVGRGENPRMTSSNPPRDSGSFPLIAAFMTAFASARAASSA
jgi:hypothetical protein